jgi:hypothetical protein
MTWRLSSRRSRPSGPVTTDLNWSAIDDEQYERLLFNILSEGDSYINVKWLTNTHATDHGRDLSAERVVHDSLSGTTHLRVIVQAKHWLTKSINVKDVMGLIGQMEFWRDPPVRVLVIATSGGFTTDAVTYIEKHNESDTRLQIEMWPKSHLEHILAERPHLSVALGLRGSPK